MKYKEMRDYTMMNLAIDQSNLYLLISSKTGWLANMLSNDEGISIVDAIKKPLIFSRTILLFKY